MKPLHSPYSETWQAELRRGLERLRKGQFEPAEACFVRAHQLAPQRPEVCYALGRVRLLRGAVAEAESLLRTAWYTDRTFVSAAGTLARCLGIYAKQFAAAHAVLDDAESHHGALSLLQVVRSELFLAEERIEEARSIAEAVVDNPDSDAAREAAQAALARALNQEGIAHAASGGHEQAVFLFQRAGRLDPEWSSPHVNLGAAFVQMGLTKRALAAYDRAVAIEPDNPVAHENRGVLLHSVGDLIGASDALVHAYIIEPGTQRVAIALAAVYRDMDEPQDAVRVLSEVIDLTPDEPSLWYELGCAFYAGGDRDNAEASWRRTLRLDPVHADACSALCDLLVRDGRFHEAAVLAQRVPQDAAGAGDTAGASGYPRPDKGP